MWQLWGMRKLALVFIFGALCLRDGFGGEVSILYRQRPPAEILQHFSRLDGRKLAFSQIPIQDRARLERWVDPFAVGHVAIKFVDPATSTTKIVGWTPANVDSLVEIDRILNYFLSSSTMQIKTPVRGGFHDDTNWAKGAILDPVFEVPLTATPRQVASLAQEVQRVHRDSWTGYQVLPNFNPFNQTWSYPRNSFNCLEAVRHVLEVAAIDVPFSIRRDGLLTPFVEAAAPYVTQRFYGAACPDIIAARNEELFFIAY